MSRLLTVLLQSSLAFAFGLGDSFSEPCRTTHDECDGRLATYPAARDCLIDLTDVTALDKASVTSWFFSVVLSWPNVGSQRPNVEPQVGTNLES